MMDEDDKLLDDEPFRKSSPKRDAILQAKRRRRRYIFTAVLLGSIVGAYTLGALDERVIAEDQNDLLPVPLEALLVAIAFTLGALPMAGSVLARVILPVPVFLLYLTVFLGKSPPLPFSAAFVLAVVYSAALASLAAYLGERPARPLFGRKRRR